MLNREEHKLTDLEMWKQYKAKPTPENRSALLRRMEGLVYKQCHKWAGPLPMDVLVGRAKLLAADSFDTYNPNKGAALSTHVTNSLLPLSRTVYTYQNAARIPENLTMKINAYNNAVNEFSIVNGRDPTTEELSQRLGMKNSEITRLRDYAVRDLVESGPAISGSGYDDTMKADNDDNMLAGLYMELDPVDQKVFEHTTGYNNAPILPLDALAKKLNITKSQLTYRKLGLRGKVERYLNRPSVRRVYGK